ncbi:MAG: alpha/beta hydrolase [Proteobacteria bacterium]|nr:alpha/beta hydrolase [Pseudomonadota bacterium]
MPTALINGVQLNYLQLDEGGAADREDLVMVHGLATNMAFWYFKYGVPLSEKYRVTLYDLRGHGRSEMPQSGYTPSIMGQDLAGLMDHLGIEKAHFLAHSFGGVVTLNFACAQPERVRSLVLNDSHFSAGRKVQARSEWTFGQKFQPLLDAHGLDLDTSDPYFGPKLLIRVAEWQLKGYQVPNELLDLVSPLLGKTGKRTSGEWLKLMSTTSAQAEMTTHDGLTVDRLRTLRFPIIAMYGDNSPARLSGEELLDIWPHAEFRRVRDAGHFFPTLRPEEVLSSCLRFWDGEFASRHQRAGEARRSHFRSDRVFMAGGAWYFTTRDENRVGPFADREEASLGLASFISAVKN